MVEYGLLRKSAMAYTDGNRSSHMKEFVKNGSSCLVYCIFFNNL